MSEANRSRLTLEHDWTPKSKSYFTVFNRFNKLGQNPAYGIRWKPRTSNGNDPTKARGEINSNDFKSLGVVAQHTQQWDDLNSKLVVGATHDYSPNAYNSRQLDLAAKLSPTGTSVEEYTIIADRQDIKLVDYDAIINNTAAYIQYSFEPIRNLHFSAGSRWDRMAFSYKNNLDNSNGKIEYTKLSNKFGVNYNLNKNIGFYGNIAQGFAPPGLTSIFRKKPTLPGAFDLDLFKALQPKGITTNILTFTGSKTGDLVHIQFLKPFKTEWISEIIADGEDEKQ